jgi:hypothetical protein
VPYPPRPDQGWTHPDTFIRDIPPEGHYVRVMPCPEPGCDGTLVAKASSWVMTGWDGRPSVYGAVLQGLRCDTVKGPYSYPDCWADRATDPTAVLPFPGPETQFGIDIDYPDYGHVPHALRDQLRHVTVDADADRSDPHTRPRNNRDVRLQWPGQSYVIDDYGYARQDKWPVQNRNGGDHFQSPTHKASIDAWTAAGGAASPQEVWDRENWEYIPNYLGSDA